MVNGRVNESHPIVVGLLQEVSDQQKLIALFKLNMSAQICFLNKLHTETQKGCLNKDTLADLNDDWRNIDFIRQGLLGLTPFVSKQDSDNLELNQTLADAQEQVVKVLEIFIEVIQASDRKIDILRLVSKILGIDLLQSKLQKDHTAPRSAASIGRSGCFAMATHIAKLQLDSSRRRGGLDKVQIQFQLILKLPGRSPKLRN